MASNTAAMSGRAAGFSRSLSPLTYSFGLSASPSAPFGAVGGWLFFWNRRGGRPADSAHALALLAAAFWIGMFFGRPFWGGLLWLAGVSPDLPLHRVIGGAQVFLTLLAAIGLAALWRELSR